MLAAPLLPSPGLQDAESYRPAKDIEAFNRLLPAPIEFIEGSSSGVLAVAEGKYLPINVPQKQSAPETRDASKDATPLPAKSPRIPSAVVSTTSLYTGPVDSSWPAGHTVGAGLNNVGNTCFLNSALQVLLHTPPLLNILHRHTKDACTVSNGFCMACAMRHVMIDSHTKHFATAPYPVLAKLQTIGKQFRRGRQEDSHEFLRCAIDALQRSCLPSPTSKNEPKVDPKLAETTWVHRIFGGRLRSRVKCLSCNHNSDTFDSMLDLSVEVAGCFGLPDALRKFVAVDHLRGADKYKCEKCKKPVPADKQFTIHEAPLVLTVHLKRFSPMGRKIGNLIRYEDRLSLAPYMSEGQFGPNYSLYGVISHAGSGPSSGHYYAHVKDANGRWFEANDESVMRQNGKPENMKNAYMLFYIQDKGQALAAAVKASATTTVASKEATLAIPRVVAAMKKRKHANDEDDVSRPPANKPFIGPRLPTPQPPTPSKIAAPRPTDPQADALKKKIAAASSPTRALQSLATYADSDDDDDVGEKVEEKAPIPPTADAPAAAAESAATDASSPSAPSPIPPASFYGPPPPKTGDKKRKSPDGDEEEDHQSESAYARAPIVASPRKRHSIAGIGFGAGNPYSRLKGSDNLQERRESAPLKRYGKKGMRKIARGL